MEIDGRFVTRVLRKLKKSKALSQSDFDKLSEVLSSVLELQYQMGTGLDAWDRAFGSMTYLEKNVFDFIGWRGRVGFYELDEIWGSKVTPDAKEKVLKSLRRKLDSGTNPTGKPEDRVCWFEISRARAELLWVKKPWVSD